MYEVGGYVNVQDAMGNHTKVVKMYDSTVANHVLMSKPVPSQTSGAVEYWVLSDDVSDESIFRALEDPLAGAYGDGIGWLSLDRDRIRYHDNIGWHDTSKTIYDNTWYRIKVEFECTTGNYRGLEQYTWRFYVDGEVFGDYSFQVNINNVSQVFFSTRGEDAGYSCYVDAVGFSWDSDYNVGDNLKEGLLLSYKTDLNLNWTGYSLDSQMNVAILGNKTIPMPMDGVHSIQIFGNDSDGIIYQSELRYFSIDTSAPDIFVISPIDNEFLGVSSPNFEISITESNLNTTWYSLDYGTENITFSGLSGMINQIEWDEEGEGPVNIRFYANDSFGFESFEDININKDLTPPSSSISFNPYITPNIVNRSTTFSISASDGTGSGVSLLRYRINNSIWYDYAGPFDLSGYSFGHYLITYQSIDAVGNVESENTLLVILVVVPSKAPEIYGFNTLLLLGLIGLMSAILIKRFKK